MAPGNETFSIPSNNSIAQGLTSICQTGATPFSGVQLTTDSFGTAATYCIDVNSGLYDDDDDDDDTDSDWQAVRLRSIVYRWFSSFNKNWLYENDTANILDASTFFANQAVLTASSDLNFALGAKWMYTNKGTLFYQPHKSLGGMIAVTALVFLQVIALLILAWYIHSTGPVWTDTLDGFAMTRIGAEMERRGKGLGQMWELGRLRFAEEEDLLTLKDVDGLVGVTAREKSGSEVEDAPLLKSTAGEDRGTAVG